MAPVDAFLVARKFIPKWRHADDSESSFFRFLRELLPTIADTNEAKCSQILIRKLVVKDGPNKGQEYAKQGRCHYCIKSKKKEDKVRSIRYFLAELRTSAVSTPASM